MALFNSIISSIGRYGRAVEKTVDKASSILDIEKKDDGKISVGLAGDENDAANIRDSYLNGFLSNESKFQPNVFSRLFDEPTYLTFRIEFNFRDDRVENNTGNKSMTFWSQSYDYMPEPFLAKNLRNLPVYSTYQYLQNNKSEGKRAAMLNTFIDSLEDIQNNYPYYFQSVDGLADLMKIDPKRGIRIPSDQNNIITIKCLEGLDMKITQLMQTYRKIVWDDYYQRWVLPDMMRYFNMKIYVSEIRLFHSASTLESKHSSPRMINIIDSLNATAYNNVSKASSILDTVNNVLNDVTSLSTQLLGTRSAVTAAVSTVGQVLDTARGLGTGLASDYYKLCNNAINNIMPTICFDCHQCEFVIDDTLSHIGSLSASTKDTKPAEPTIKIKVGRLMDEQVYPLNKSISSSFKNNEYIQNDRDEYTYGTKFSDDILRDDELKTQAGSYTKQNNLDQRISSLGVRTNPKLADENAIGNLAYRPHHTNSQQASMALLKGVLNFFTQDEARSAATTINSIKEYVYNGDVIRSVATSDENRRKIADGVFVQTLDEIVKSQATSGTTALTALSEHILDSLATNGELKIKK